MNYTLPPQLPFWQECLRLVYWVYFKPITLERYINALAPDLPKAYSLWQARYQVLKNPRLQKLLLQSWLLTLLFLLLGEWFFWINGVPIDSELVTASIFACVLMNIWFTLFMSVWSGLIAGWVVALFMAAAFPFRWLGSDIRRFNFLFDVSIGVMLGTSAGFFSASQARSANIVFIMYILPCIVVFSVVGLEHGVVLGVIIFAIQFRLYQSPFYTMQITLIWWWARQRPMLTHSLVQLAPHHLDETIAFPLPLVNDFAQFVARQNLSDGLREVEFLLSTKAQKQQGWYALAGITADVAASYTTISEVCLAPTHIDWLPDDLRLISSDTAEIIPALFAISRDLATFATSSTLSKRATLRDALDRLSTLHKRLGFLRREARERWEPALNQWNKVLMQALDALPTEGANDAISNPYQVGNPLNRTREALFKGRVAERQKLINAMREQQRATIVLTGPRRMGKSSFLLQLAGIIPGNMVPVFIDLQKPAHTASDAAFFYAVARAIATDAEPYKLIMVAPVRAKFDASPYEAFDEWLTAQALPYLNQRNYRLLLTFDEFDKVGEALQAGRLTRQVFDQLRYLIQHVPRLSLLFAGMQTLDELGPEWSAYFVNLRALNLGHLEPPEAEELIRRPDATFKFPLTYTDDAVQRIQTLTQGHPYLVQLLCSCAVERANAQRTRMVGLPLLAEAESLALERGEPYFRDVWDEMATPLAQPLLRRLATESMPQALTAPEDLRAAQRLSRYRLAHGGGGQWQITVPLVGRWVVERAPL